MSGIVGGINLRSSGLINNSSAADGQIFTGTGAGLPAGFEAAAGGGGKVLKVTSHIHQATASVDSTTFATVVTKAITLEESDSKVLILWTMWIGRGADTAGKLRILRDTTDLTSAFGGTAANTGAGEHNVFGLATAFAGHAGITYNPTPSSGNILDTPGGDVTYNFQIARMSGCNPVYINTGSVTGDNAYLGKPACHTMFIEIAA